jgi:hypothetical protein
MGGKPRAKPIFDPFATPHGWRERNPFTNAYLREEVEMYGQPPVDDNGVKIIYDKPVGRIDDYLNINFCVLDFEVPLLFIDGRIWMSLTRMEVQSQHLPIQFAGGEVGTCGLGLGHFVLRAMAKPDVDSIKVFESDPRIIKFFTEAFRDRPGFDKVQIIEGNARETCRGHYFDFLYADIYPTLLADECITDIALFNDNNEINENGYHFWGLERVVMDALQQDLIEGSMLDFPTRYYFHKWFTTSIREAEGDDPDDDYLLPGYWRVGADPDYCRKALTAMASYHPGSYDLIPGSWECDEEAAHA